jgi:predicted transcriptional regulator
MSDQRNGAEADLALKEVADAAEVTAEEQREVAAVSKGLSQDRGRGASWSDLTRGERFHRLLDLLGASSRRLVEVAGSFRRVLVAVLAAEGLTTRKIGERFGISHQRISSLLRRQK